jgi:hypothetical protein
VFPVDPLIANAWTLRAELTLGLVAIVAFGFRTMSSAKSVG